MDPIRTEINAVMTKINELSYQRRSIASKSVPVTSPGWFGITRQKNKNKAAADTKARDATLAQVDNEIAELIARLQTLYSNLIQAIPTETKDILNKHNFKLIKINNEDPYYIKKNTNRKIGEYGSGAPIIERDTMILINSDIVDKVDEFDKYQMAMNAKKIQNEIKAKNAIDKEQKDNLIIKRYEAKGYIYKPNEKRTRTVDAQFGSHTYEEAIPPFLEYQIKSYYDISGWTEGTEDTKVTVYGPSSGSQEYNQHNLGKEVTRQIPIWTRELPEGFPQRIGVGSDKFYTTIEKIDQISGGKRSKRKTLKKKKRSSKKLN